MRRFLIASTLLLMASVSAQGQAGAAGPRGDDSLEQQLIRVKRDWGGADVRRDIALLERILAPDYTVTDDSGHTTGRDEVMADFKAAAVTYEAASYDDVKVRVYGAVAIVAGRGTVKGRNSRGNFHREYFSTNVFFKRDGRWQAVATHISGVRAL